MKKARYDLKDNAKKDKIICIEVRILEWFQKSYGNSYFAGTVELFSDSELVRRIILDYQYGDGGHAEYTAAGEIGFSNLRELLGFCKENKIHYSFNKEANCRERDLRNLVLYTQSIPVEETEK